MIQWLAMLFKEYYAMKFCVIMKVYSTNVWETGLVVFKKVFVVNSDGDFFVYNVRKGTYKKAVSQKDSFLYHDSCCINASKLVYCTFVKNHPGLNGTDEEDYKIIHLNGKLYDLRIDNLELKKVKRYV